MFSDITKFTDCDATSNLTLTTRLHNKDRLGFTITYLFKPTLKSCFLAILKVQGMFPPVFIPDNHTRALRINVNVVGKKLKFSDFMVQT